MGGVGTNAIPVEQGGLNYGEPNRGGVVPYDSGPSRGQHHVTYVYVSDPALQGPTDRAVALWNHAAGSEVFQVTTNPNEADITVKWGNQKTADRQGWAGYTSTIAGRRNDRYVGRDYNIGGAQATVYVAPNTKAYGNGYVTAIVTHEMGHAGGLTHPAEDTGATGLALRAGIMGHGGDEPGGARNILPGEGMNLAYESGGAAQPFSLPDSAQADLEREFPKGVGEYGTVPYTTTKDAQGNMVLKEEWNPAADVQVGSYPVLFAQQMQERNHPLSRALVAAADLVAAGAVARGADPSTYTPDQFIKDTYTMASAFHPAPAPKAGTPAAGGGKTTQKVE